GHRAPSEPARGLAAQDRDIPLAGGLPRRRGGAAGAARRSARPRALPLPATAARPLHAANPAGQAAVALGVHPARGAWRVKPRSRRGRGGCWLGVRGCWPRDPPPVVLARPPRGPRGGSTAPRLLRRTPR